MGKSTAKVATATGQSGHDRSAGLRKHLTLVVAGFLGMGLVAAVSGCTISPPIPAPAPAVTPAYGVFAPTVAWSATFGGTGEDQFWALAVADDGSMIVAGDTDSADGDFSPSQGDCDAVLARVSPAGELEWSLTLGGTKDDSFRSVLLQPDGSIVAVGYSDSVDGDFVRNGGSGGGIAARVTADGHLSWARSYGSASDTFLSAAMEPDGSIIASGWGQGPTGLLAHILPTGKLDWINDYSDNGETMFASVTMGTSGDVVVAGQWCNAGNSTAVNCPAGIAHIDPAGQISNEHVYQSDSLAFFDFEVMAIDPAGNLVIAGDTHGCVNSPTDQPCNGEVAFIQPDGQVSWVKVFAGWSMFRAVSVSLTDTITVAGLNASSTSGDFPASQGAFDGALARLTPDGQITWAGTYGGSSSDEFESLVVTSDGTIVVAGRTSSPDGDFPTSLGAGDALVARFTPVNDG